MNKFVYVLICILLSINFWELSFIIGFLSKDIILILTWLWALGAFVFFKGKPRIYSLYSLKYIQYMYWTFLGVFVSMFSAYLFWGQSLITTFIAQRFIYSFILLPALLYVQPTEKDIIKALKWISISTIIVWIIGAIFPFIISIDEEIVIRKQVSGVNDFGFLVPGIKFVVLYFYFIIAEFIKLFKWKRFLDAMLLLMFIFLFQNRSLLLGAIIVVFYSLFKFRSKIKIVHLVIIIGIIFSGLLYSEDVWISLINETHSQFNNQDYNRWKALFYYFFEYSPNWFCYVFGNGFPSLKSSFGDSIITIKTIGIHYGDLGMIGMWTLYGIIPIIAIYSVLVRILLNRKFPLYLKFISFHIVFIPIIFESWNTDVFLFVLIIYLFALFAENYRMGITR